MLNALPPAKEMLGDRGTDAEWFCNALDKRGITGRSNGKTPTGYNHILHRQRHKIENMFGRIKDWRRIHTRYDRCAHIFMSAICIAATVIFWI